MSMVKFVPAKVGFQLEALPNEGYVQYILCNEGT